MYDGFRACLAALKIPRYDVAVAISEKKNTHTHTNWTLHGDDDAKKQVVDCSPKLSHEIYALRVFSLSFAVYVFVDQSNPLHNRNTMLRGAMVPPLATENLLVPHSAPELLVLVATSLLLELDTSASAAAT